MKTAQRANRAIIIVPNYGNDINSLATTPVPSAGYLAKSISECTCYYQVIDMRFNYSKRYVYRFIKNYSPVSNYAPEIIFVSMLTYKYQETYNLIRWLKHKFDKPIMVGGSHVTTYKELVLKQCKHIDYGCIGECEGLIPEFIMGDDLSTIKGLIYRKDGNIISNKERKFKNNIDEYGYPTYHNFQLKKYYCKEIPIVTSRGCPFSCVYCPVGNSIGKKFRYKSPESVVDEIEYWYNKGYNKISIVDDNFTLIRQRVVDICGLLRLRKLDVSIDLREGIRADKTDYELLKMMKEVGFEHIGIGVEGGNNRILKMINKQENIEEIELAIKNAVMCDLKVSLFFLVGSPGETKRDVSDSISIAKKYPVERVYFYNLIPYPQTPLFEWIKKNGRFLYKPEYYLNNIISRDIKPVFDTKEFTATQRVQALKQCRKVSKEIEINNLSKTQGKFLANFAGLYYSKQFSRVVGRIIRNDTLRRLKDKIYHNET